MVAVISSAALGQGGLEEVSSVVIFFRRDSVVSSVLINAQARWVWFFFFFLAGSICSGHADHAPPLLCSNLRSRFFQIWFWANSSKSRDFSSVCFALLGQWLRLQSALLPENLPIDASHPLQSNPAKWRVCVEGNFERKRENYYAKELACFY